MSRFIDECKRAAILFLMSSLLLSGCSSSGDSPALSEGVNVVGEIDQNASTDQGETNEIAVDGETGSVDESSVDESSDGVASDDVVGLPANESSNVITTDDVVDLPTTGASADVPDPMVQNSTDVTFNITVPAYKSNKLQLQLSWGEFSTSFNWVGDELWTTDVTLPTNTEHLLSIVFYDDNGGIELGSFEQQYRTGINAAEVYEINAEQFDSDRWDFDGDGTSNLDELIAGTDPQADEESLIPTVDIQPMSLLFIANYFETLMPNERPYMGTKDETVNEYAGTITAADIDANGNGSLVINELPYVRFNTRTGERLVLDNTVQWSGTWNYSDDFYLRQSFDSKMSVDGDTRRLVEQGNGSWVGTYTHQWQTTVDVTGQKIEGSAFCEVATGTITENYTNNQDSVRSNTLTISRESVDDLWRVSEVYEIDGESFTTEIFARELSMHMIRFGYQIQVSENDHFLCDYSDL